MDISPFLAATTGPEFARSLRQRLEELAADTDDPAYARRLREIAAGKRPLRTLAADPAWNATQTDRAPAPQASIALSEEEREEFAKRVAELPLPPTLLPNSLDDAMMMAREILNRIERTAAMVRADELNGWQSPDRPKGDFHG
ncbi:MAG: hypothetical protein HGA51_10185 [Demequinaceae bacterium]|nr:hypothetical protein [Demequinaceae bacterium]